MVDEMNISTCFGAEVGCVPGVDLAVERQLLVGLLTTLHRVVRDTVIGGTSHIITHHTSHHTSHIITNITYHTSHITHHTPHIIEYDMPYLEFQQHSHLRLVQRCQAPRHILVKLQPYRDTIANIKPSIT